MKVVFEITDLSMASLKTWISIRMKTAVLSITVVRPKRYPSSTEIWHALFEEVRDFSFC